MYQFYVVLKDAFQDKVRILYTENDSFFVQFFVDDLPNVLEGDDQSFANLILPTYRIDIRPDCITIQMPEKSNIYRTSATQTESSSLSDSDQRFTRLQ